MPFGRYVNPHRAQPVNKKRVVPRKSCKFRKALHDPGSKTFLPRWLICDADNLLGVSEALQGVRVRAESFEGVLDRAEPGDLVYLDPPYLPVSKTSSFVSYSAAGFCLEDHERLAEVFCRLHRRGVRVLLSSPDLPWVRNRYPDFDLVQVRARRSVNARAGGRGWVGEVVVRSTTTS